MSAAPKMIGMAILVLLAVGDVAAQRIDVSRAGFTMGRDVTTSLNPADELILFPGKYPETCWKTGALITGIPAVVMFNLVAVGDDLNLFQQTVGRVVSSALVGAVFAVPVTVLVALLTD